MVPETQRGGGATVLSSIWRPRTDDSGVMANDGRECDSVEIMETNEVV